jgi:hypothetical protein
MSIKKQKVFYLEPSADYLKSVPRFEGFTTGHTWNGWARPWFTKSVRDQFLSYYSNPNNYLDQASQEAFAITEWLSDYENIKPNEDGLYNFGGSLCWEEYTEEQREEDCGNDGGHRDSGRGICGECGSPL